MKALQHDMIVADYVIPAGFKTDGCTMCGFLKWLLRANRFYDLCVLHDFMRRHLVHYDLVTVKHADEYFKQQIRKRSSYLYARIYWIGVRLGRNIYTQTQPFPDDGWLDYAFPHGPIWLKLKQQEAARLTA